MLLTYPRSAGIHPRLRQPGRKPPGLCKDAAYL